MIGMLRRREMMAQSKIILPSEYQRVEYLQNISQSYINTGVFYYTDDIPSIYIKCELNEINTGYSSYPIGMYKNYPLTSSISINFRKDTQSFVVSMGEASNILGTGVISYTLNTQYNFEINTRTGSYVNNSLVNPNIYMIFEDSLEMPLFTNRPNTASLLLESFVGKIYYCRMCRNGEDIRNFIPCYRKDDNKPGMYDTVNDMFYTNAGRDEFIVGPNI